MKVLSNSTTIYKNITKNQCKSATLPLQQSANQKNVSFGGTPVDELADAYVDAFKAGSQATIGITDAGSRAALAMIDLWNPRSWAQPRAKAKQPIKTTRSSVIKILPASTKEKFYSMPIHNTLFNPRGVVVVGASGSDLTKPGSAILGNIINAGFIEGSRKLYAVNGKGGNAIYADNSKQVQKFPAYKSVKEVPDEKIDTAIIVVPAPMVLDAVRECKEKGVKGVVVISSDFKETHSTEGIQREQDLKQYCIDNNISLIGPNCLGISTPSIGLNANFSPAESQFMQGNCGFFSQSGAMGIAVANTLGSLGLGVSKFASIGNKAGCSETEFMDYFKNDKETSVILGYLESILNPQEFANKAIEVGKEKPIILLKAGRSQSGAKAAAAHTGSAAGGDGVYDALFKRAGIIRAHHSRDMFLYSQAFSKAPLPKGRDLAIVSNGGGAGTLGTDAAEVDFKLTIASLDNDSINNLKKNLPAAASSGNPIDTTATIDPEKYVKALDMVLQSPKVKSIIAYLVPIGPNLGKHKEILDSMKKLQDKYKKPILAVFQADESSMKEIRSYSKVPIFDTPEEATQALAKMCEYAEWKEKNVGKIAWPKAQPLSQSNQEMISNLIQDALDNGVIETQSDGARTLALNTDASMKIFKAYGINTPISVKIEDGDVIGAFKEYNRQAHTNSERELKFPVVLKIASDHPAASHKSDVGGVIINIQDEQQLKAAYNKMKASVNAYNSKVKAAIQKEVQEKGLTGNTAKNYVDAHSSARIIPEGELKKVQIQEMVKGDYEIFAATHFDKASNMNTLTVGLGGTLVDAYSKLGIDKATTLPATARDIEDLVMSSPAEIFFRTNSKGEAYRGMKPANLESCRNQLLSLGQMAKDLGAADINCNPLKVCSDGTIMAVDARILLNVDRIQRLPDQSLAV